MGTDLVYIDTSKALKRGERARIFRPLHYLICLLVVGNGIHVEQVSLGYIMSEHAKRCCNLNQKEIQIVGKSSALK
mgnify:CR=1 FL=1